MGTQTVKKREESSIHLQMRLCHVTLLLFVLLALALSAFALDPQKAVTQFVHTSWTEKDGAPPGIWALAQTTDGYLWLGTDAGLFRFDGLRFVRFEPQAGESLPGARILRLFATHDGALWIASAERDTWCRLFNGHLSRLENIPPVYQLVEAPDGTLVAGTEKGLWRLKDGIWGDVSKEWNFPGRLARGIYFDKSGTLWVVTEDHVVYRPAGQSQFVAAEQLPGNAQMRNLSEAPDGSMWISEVTRSAHSLLRKGERGPITEVRVGASWVLFDRNGSLWIGSAGGGLGRVADPGKIKGRQVAQFGPGAQFTVKEGLSGNYVLSMLEDQEGNIWVGTLKGLDRFRESSFFPVAIDQPEAPRFFQTTRDGSLLVAGNDLDVLRISPLGNQVVLGHLGHLGHITLSAMCEDETGVLWAVDWAVGMHGSLRRYQQGRFVPISLPGGVIVSEFDSMACDRAGGIWLFDDERGLFRLANGALTRLLDNPERAPRVGFLYADREGRIWLGETNRVWLYEHGKLQVFGNKDGVPIGRIFAFHMDRAGNIWAGGDGGLIKFENGRFRSLSQSNGLPVRSIHGIAEDDYGCLWIAGGHGVLRVPIVELDRALADPVYLLRYESLDALDGLPGNPLLVTPLPIIARTLDRRIWFATTNGIAYVDPQHIPKNNLHPPVQVESLSANGRDYSPWDTVKLPARTTSLQVAYTALSLTIPERVRFRYRLEGVENDWQEAGTQRTTKYSNLGPGAYRFRVIACNNDGVWNEVGATLNFSILPAWYQTLWFRGFYIAAAMAMLYLLYLLRLRQVTQRVRGQIVARFEEREKIARDLHDTLLQSVQGLILKFHALARQVPAGEVRQGMDQALDHADEVLVEGRDRVRNLRGTSESLDDLPSAFYRVAEAAAPDSAASLKVVVEGNVRELHPMVLEETFSIGREALINALHHSQGLHVEVEIAYDSKQFRLRVCDDGRGIDPEVLQQGGRPDHWGLPGMRERAQAIGAQLQLSSRPEAGTQVELKVPAAAAYRSVSTWLGKFRLRRSFRIDG